MARLYDPIPPSYTMASGFRNQREAALYLFRNRFLPQIPGTGRGWTSLLSPSRRSKSRFDGMSRPGHAYRQDAGLVYDAASRTWAIRVQGTPTFGEPSPELALAFGSAWFNYVRDWHARF